MLSILWTDHRFPEPILSGEGLVSLSRSLTFPLQVTSEFFNEKWFSEDLALLQVIVTD